MRKVIGFLFFILISNNIFASQSKFPPKSMEKNELSRAATPFIDKDYIENSLDNALYKAWLRLDEALSNWHDEENIVECQNAFLEQLEREKEAKTFNLARSMYGLHSQLQEMEIACKNKDRAELSRLVTAFYISKGLVYQKSSTLFMQLIVIIGLLIIIMMALLFLYQFTYARRIKIENILKATNKAQEEERRRLALELHDSVAQQMRYVSILAEKISDEELKKEIKSNISECIENLRNTCYALSSINMDKGNFPAILQNSIENFQKRTKISTSLVITPDVDFEQLSKISFNHLYRVIMELLVNIEKHSGAREVTVLIRRPSGSDKIKQGIMVFISDDGDGLDSKTLEEMNSKTIASVKNMHFGLQNIKLRLNEIGGTIKFVSEKGEGTEVEIGIEK